MKHPNAETPLYGVIAALGGSWTIVFHPHGTHTARSLSGYGEFPFAEYPDMPVIDHRTSIRVETSFYVAEEYGQHFPGGTYLPLAQAIERWRAAGCTIIEHSAQVPSRTETAQPFPRGRWCFTAL